MLYLSRTFRAESSHRLTEVLKIHLHSHWCCCLRRKNYAHADYRCRSLDHLLTDTINRTVISNRALTCKPCIRGLLYHNKLFEPEQSLAHNWNSNRVKHQKICSFAGSSLGPFAHHFFYWPFLQWSFCSSSVNSSEQTSIKHSAQYPTSESYLDVINLFYRLRRK